MNTVKPARQARALKSSLQEGWYLAGWTIDARPVVEKSGRRMAINPDGEHIPTEKIYADKNTSGDLFGNAALSVAVAG